MESVVSKNEVLKTLINRQIRLSQSMGGFVITVPKASQASGPFRGIVPNEDAGELANILSVSEDLFEIDRIGGKSMLSIAHLREIAWRK